MLVTLSTQNSQTFLRGLRNLFGARLRTTLFIDTLSHRAPRWEAPFKLSSWKRTIPLQRDHNPRVPKLWKIAERCL